MRRKLLEAAAAILAVLAFVSFISAEEGAASSIANRQTRAARSYMTPSGRELRTDPALVAAGHKLFLSSCSVCHGFDAEGIPGKAPSLHGVGELSADFFLQTGRMPLSYPYQQPFERSPAFPQPQIKALIAYVGSLGGPPIPTVNLALGSRSTGQRLFAVNCAGCHQIQGRGGIVTGAVVPWLSEATPTLVAEAVRIGPYVMPRWSGKQLTERDVDAIAHYVQTLSHPEAQVRGGWGIDRLGPIPEGMVTWLLALGSLIIVIRLIGERTPQ